MVLSAVIQFETNLVLYTVESENPINTPAPDFVVEVLDDTIVEVGWTYVPGDTPESYTFVPPAPLEE